MKDGMSPFWGVLAVVITFLLLWICGGFHPSFLQVETLGIFVVYASLGYLLFCAIFWRWT